ncbi:HAD-IIB family hydrolase [Planococcus liqunii]|uniref:HAD-IIB family hydrolase n=1 Tax=Planococcus liqunii TaxID=3058394 RepID=A0ABT8MWJ1_9BACL|nr:MULTISPECIES: HAD-IIB family hydrolase [unclassified Planococcus (in: firmicutes)]MDN7229123.1 HAD-IIB family hydrolase [Planococcus sp. N064]WKA51540.1 HAD-IIB family hydrolase [Planococcus sp. N056]
MQKTKHILATDLDGTLVGDPDGLQQLLEFYEEQVYDVSLIYITGRYFDSALSLIEEENLPVPDILVTDVGSSIYVGNSFDKDLEWQKRIKANWMPEEIHAIAATVPGLTKQPMFLENRCSYYVSDEKPVEEFRNKLAASGIPHKLIFSGGKDVDIVPMESGKGRALQYLLDKYKVEDAKLLVAGDSGNDLEMLTLGFPSVIVGNAQPELLESDEHPRIFRAKKGFAGGIHEAWTHFHSE